MTAGSRRPGGGGARAAVPRGAELRGGAHCRALKSRVARDPPAGNGAFRAAGCCGASRGAGWAPGRGPGVWVAL